MKREEIIKYCLELPNVYEDYPFPEDNFSVTIYCIYYNSN